MESAVILQSFTLCYTYLMDVNLSICIIAKNEEKNLRHCLQGVVPLQCEIILVDTGSSDKTISIASEYTSHIYTIDWKDDFSAARNYAAEKASSDWILMVDCDEYLTEADLVDLEDTMRQYPDQVGMIRRLSPYTTHGNGQLLHEHVARLYNRTLYKYQGKIHENIVPIKDTDVIRYFEVPLTFYHAGYEDEAVRRRKAQRDLKMLDDALTENGEDPYIFFQLGQCYTVLGETAKAAECYDHGLSMHIDPRLTYVKDMVDAYGYALLDLQQYEKALSLEAVYDDFSDRADYLFLMGLIYMNNARLEDAIKQFTKATQTPIYSVEGVNDYSARYNIGVIYEVTGELDKAIAMYKACGSYQPALARLEKLEAG